MNLLKIKKIAEGKNITLTALSSKIEMSYQNLNRCIKNNEIQATALEKVAEVLNVPVSYFFEENPWTGKAKSIITNGHFSNNVNSKVITTGEDNEIQLLKMEVEKLVLKVEGLERETEGLKRENLLLKEINELLKGKS